MREIVIIGGVAAGMKAAAKARRCDREAKITVIEKGALVSYGACGMPYYVSGEVAELDSVMKTPAGVLRNPGFFKNVKNIDVRVETLVTAINRSEKTLELSDLKSGAKDKISYDKLVIATGATPVRPDLKGMELDNIRNFWQPDDAQAVRAELEKKKIKNAAVIGAGLIGLEMTEALLSWGVQVSVIEMKEQVLPALLDPEISALAEKQLVAMGAKVFCGERVVAFSGEKSVAMVETDRRSIAADLVIIAVGARPNTKLAQEAGLEIGVSGGLVVDECLRTSDPDIYAGGDCVENMHLVSGRKLFSPMGSTANRQGRVIGENICGAALQFKGVLATAVLRLQEMTVGRTGVSESEAKMLGYEYVTAMISGHDRPHYMPGAKLITLKVIVDAKSRKLLGLQAIGTGEIAKRVDVAATLLTLGGTVDDLVDIDLSYAPPYNMPIDALAVAANAVLNKMAGRLKGISPIEAKEKLEKGKSIFLDVRSPEECAQLKLGDEPSICYIPLGQLRRRCNELQKDGEIIAFCKISLRGYEAEVILEGEGFKDVKIIEGGLAAWPYQDDSVVKTEK